MNDNRTSLAEQIRRQGINGLVLDRIRPRVGTGLVPADSWLWNGIAAGCDETTPLLPAGMWAMSAPDLHAIAVKPFRSPRRAQLWQSFERFRLALSSWNVAREFWIGGSFLSDKEEPTDLDLVAVLLYDRVAALGLKAGTELYEKVLDQAALLCDGLDESVIFEGDLTLRAYWQGALGFGWNRSRVRGIAVLPPGPA